MSSVVSSIFGGGGNAPGQVQSPISQAQTNTAFGNTQTGLAQQQAFLQALQAQNGIQNQSDVFNQLQGVAQGTGPNPAQAQLAQATGANVANQAALMAGQRGASANTGLLGRQTAMQGANTQQQAAGQAATLQAQQSLNALGQMGQLAGQQVANQGAATQGYTGAANQQLGTAVGAQNQTNAINSQAQQAQAATQGNVLHGITGALGTGLGMMFGGPAGAVAGGALANGLSGGTAGQVGGVGIASMLPGASGNAAPVEASGYQSPLGGTSFQAEDGMIEPKSYVTRHMMAKGGAVPAMVSPGEQYLPPQAVKAVADGKATPLSVGERIPGTPKVGGNKNSYQNDTVAKTLESGGIVLPRSVTMSKTPEKDAAAFVKAIIAKKQGLSKK